MSANRLLLFLIILLNMNCQEAQLSKQETKQLLANTDHFHAAFEKLTDVIVHDIFSPPVASRVYVYPSIAAYETLALDNANYPTYGGRLNELESIQDAKQTEGCDINLASTFAFLLTAKELVFSHQEIDQHIEALREELAQKKISKAIIDASFAQGSKVAKHILDWAAKDQYKETRSAPKFTISQEPGRWKPTPPAFMEGIEPNWRSMRTLVLQDLSPYQPQLKTTFSTQPESDFFQQVLEAKLAVDQANEEQRAIAAFWDCNPYVMNVTGHMMYASKKITPGGHWMGICALASKQAQLDLAATTEIHSRTAIAIYDAFISCWDEKYNSNLIRPETVINEHIDQDWKPILQTPPFPEYTSGHSVISTAAAYILTDYFGDNFQYEDSVELKYGLPSRSYRSFREAAAEAAISRLYGGIHYRPAIEDGEVQGGLIGDEIIKRIKKSKTRNGTAMVDGARAR